MKKNSLVALVVGTALLSGTAAMAEKDMKCGAGKCGNSKTEKKADMKSKGDMKSKADMKSKEKKTDKKNMDEKK